MVLKLTFEEFIDSTNWENVIDGSETHSSAQMASHSQAHDYIGEAEEPVVSTQLLDGAQMSDSLTDYFKPAKKVKVKRKSGNAMNSASKFDVGISKKSTRELSGPAPKPRSKLADLQSDPNIVVKVQNGKRVAPTTPMKRKKEAKRTDSNIGVQPLYLRLSAKTDTFHSPRTLYLALSALRDVYPVGDLSTLRDQIAVKIDDYEGFTVGTAENPMELDGAADLDSAENVGFSEGDVVLWEDEEELVEEDEERYHSHSYYPDHWADCSCSESDSDSIRSIDFGTRERLVVDFNARPIRARRQLLVKLKTRGLYWPPTLDGSGGEETRESDQVPARMDTLFESEQPKAQETDPDLDAEINLLRGRLQALEAQKRRTKFVSLRRIEKLRQNHTEKAGRRAVRKPEPVPARLLYNKFSSGVGKKPMKKLSSSLDRLNFGGETTVASNATKSIKVSDSKSKASTRTQASKLRVKLKAIQEATENQNLSLNAIKSEPTEGMLDGANDARPRIPKNDVTKWKNQTPTFQQLKAQWKEDCNRANELGLRPPPFRETPEQTAQIHEEILKFMQQNKPPRSKQRNQPKALDGPYSSSPEMSLPPKGLEVLAHNRARGLPARDKPQYRHVAPPVINLDTNDEYCEVVESPKETSCPDETIVIESGEDELDFDDDFNMSYQYFVKRESWSNEHNEHLCTPTILGPFMTLSEANAKLCSAVFGPIRSMRPTPVRGSFEQDQEGRLTWTVQADHIFISTSIYREQVAESRSQSDKPAKMAYLIRIATDAQTVPQGQSAQDIVGFSQQRIQTSDIIKCFTRRSAANGFASRELYNRMQTQITSETLEKNPEYEWLEYHLRNYLADLNKQGLDDSGKEDGFETRNAAAPSIGLFDQTFNLPGGHSIHVWVEEIEIRGPRN